VVAAMPTPWRWKWAWNGPTASGGISAGKFGLPRNSQPVTGGGRVYVAAGSHGVFALDNANGNVLWNKNPGGDILSTPAYDGDTQALFVFSSNGTLYKLDAATGNTAGEVAGGVASNLPLPPALAGNRVYAALGNRVYAINKTTMAVDWSYDAGAAVHTPPAYSPSTDLVVAASQDLYVHAIRNADGVRAWREKLTALNPGDPGGSAALAEVFNGWPVIAESHGLVLVKLRLNWATLYTWSPWSMSNATMRTNLVSRPDQQVLMALRLADGKAAFVANLGHGGFGDGNYLPMGPQPVVKRFATGQEVAYMVIRGRDCLPGDTTCDGRWDSHFGELMLDDTTVAGYSAGYVRFMENTFFPTDEQVFLSMAGDQIFGGHWEAGIAHAITDRTESRGSFAAPIVTSDLPNIVTSQDQDQCGAGFSTSHYCGSSLYNTRQWPAGFYSFWKQGAVYDQYWSGYAQWVPSNDTLYFVGTDGTVVALAQGQPSGIAVATASDTISAANAPPLPAPITYSQAREFAGSDATVEGTLYEVFNNGKAVYLGFKKPHQGEFLVRILKKDWGNFTQLPETLYAPGEVVRVTGKIEWYQGDPVIYVTGPAQIEWMSDTLGGGSDHDQ